MVKRDMRRILPFVACTALTCAGVGLAEAQGRDAGATATGESAQQAGDDEQGPLVRFVRGRLSLHLNAAYRAGLRPEAVTTAFRAYGEEARFQVLRELAGTPFADVGGALNVWRDLAVGASYGEVHGTAVAAVTGTVPHPLDFDRHRTAPVTAIELAYRERATHVHVSWRVPLTDALDLTIFAGPSFFNVRHDVVANVRAAEAGGPPFSEVVLEVDAGTHTRNAAGGNAGVDVAYMANPMLGFGYFARYVRGFVEMPSVEGSTRNVEVGGFQTGAGVRVRF